MPDWSDITDAIMGFPFGLLIAIGLLLLIAAMIKYGTRFLEWLYSWTFPKPEESDPKEVHTESSQEPHGGDVGLKEKKAAPESDRRDAPDPTSPPKPPIANLRSIEFIPVGNKGRLELTFMSHRENAPTSVDDLDASDFWLLYYLAMEYDSEGTKESWLQFPENHLDEIDIISEGWFGHDYLTQLDRKYRIVYGAEVAPSTNNRDDLKRVITDYDKKALEELHDLRRREGISWMFDISGDSRKNIRSTLIKRFSQVIENADRLFIDAERSIAYRINAFQINPELTLEIFLPKES